MANRKKKEYKIPKTKEEKFQLVKQLGSEFNRKYKGVKISLAKDLESKERLNFGIEEIDKFTGGGAVAGNYIIIYGSPDTGKSTLVQNLIGKAQEKGKVCAYIDLEHKFDKNWAMRNGVNIDELIYVGNLDTGEQAMDIVSTFAQNRAVDLIVVDSIQAISPKGEQTTKGGKEKSIEDDEVGLLAKKVTKFLRVTTSKISKANIAMVLIGQLRIQGIGSFHTYTGLSGGYALKYWSILTLLMRQGEKKNAPHTYEVDPIGDKQKVYTGFECVMKMEKKQITDEGAKSLAELRLPFYFDTGFKRDISKEKLVEETKEEQKLEKEEIPKRKRGRPKKVKETK